MYDYCLTIPVYNESANFLEPLFAHLPSHALIICIVNAPRGASQTALARNQQFINTISHPNVLVIDHQTPHINVGGARKLACDIALFLKTRGLLKTQWLHCTDADAVLPENYFERTQPLQASAAVYPFKHTTPKNEQHALAMKLYERTLHYYVNQLKKANSPYAYHSIGSTIAIDMTAYAKVRGFPKREAGEDFYMLNKLAKVGDVISLPGDPIILSSRLSDRVPFGTGPALSRILRLDNPEQDYLYYHPDIFQHLTTWLALLARVSEDPNNWNTEFGRLAKPTQTVLTHLGATQAIRACLARSPTAAKRLRHCHTWFDAFRTLKFVHGMRDLAYPSQPWEAITCSVYSSA